MSIWRNIKRFLGLEKIKKRGPFQANRILDTDEVKIDQVFTEDNKPVVLFASITEEQSKKIGAEGYIKAGKPSGPLGSVGGKGSYEREKTWSTYPIFWPDNLSNALPLDQAYPQIKRAVEAGPGTLLPETVSIREPQYNVPHVNSIPISDNAQLKIQRDGITSISGDMTINTSKIMKKEDEEDEEERPNE